jgi:hypothetical protein
MGSPITVKIKCRNYLIQFLYGKYGPPPVAFPKKNDFNNLLEYLLDVPPLDFREIEDAPDVLLVQVPFFEYKNVTGHYYLSGKKQIIFSKRVYQYFKIVFRAEINAAILQAINKKDAIEVFQEKYNMTPDSTDALEKDYQRYIEIRCRQRLFRKNKNSSDKGIICPADAMDARGYNGRKMTQ